MLNVTLPSAVVLSSTILIVIMINDTTECCHTMCRYDLFSTSQIVNSIMLSVLILSVAIIIGPMLIGMMLNVL